MLDIIEVLGAILAILLAACAVFKLYSKSYLFAFVYLIISIWPLLWAGFFRLPIPQTLVWMGMNIFAIIFLWQGVLGFVLRANKNDLLPIPRQLSRFTRNFVSVILGFLFAGLIILTRV